MDIVTTQKYIHTTPRKLRLVADMVRKMEPSQAVTVLKFTPKAAAKDLSSAIKTALANARQAGLTSEKVEFKVLEINEGPKMKRFRAGSRGRANPYQRRMAAIRIVLSDEEKVVSGSVKRKEKKPERDPSVAALPQDGKKVEKV